MTSTRIGKWSGIAAVITVSMVLSSAPAFAQSAVGEIVLSGQIAAINQISVDPTVDVYNALNLANTQVNLVVATVLEESNHTTGYTVTLVSANAFAAGNGQARLMSTDVDNSHGIDYTMFYGPGSGTAVTLASGSAIVTSTAGAASDNSTDNNLGISYTGNGFLNADTYTDTLTLTIANKG
jgi:hypothetical protein